MTLAEIYKLAAKKGAPGEKARRLLGQTDWFTRMVDFDPRSGEALPQALTPFLRRVADKSSESGWKYRDRLARLTDHCRHSLEHVIVALNESPRREHAEMSLRSVRELDAVCFMKLSSRPGRTIREKIAAKPSIVAVRRYQSVDLPENRLVKAFAMRLVEILRERAKCLGAGPADLVETLERWLRSDVARTVSRWDNPPPNNVLLSHHDYRRIYDAWCWMQSLDADVHGDFLRLEARKACVEFWKYVAELRFHKDVYFDEIPIVFDYGRFSIRPLRGGVLHMRGVERRLRLSIGKALPFSLHNRPPDSPLPKVEDPVCIDFSGETSVFSADGKLSACLPCHLAWQQWKTPDKSVEISLLEAQDIHMGANIVTVRVSDFFTAPDDIRENAQQAAMSIGSDLRRVFRNDSFAWLVPDIVDDFQLTPLRQAINAVFSNATPVPRSIAAVVRRVDLGKVGKGFTVVVVDRLGDAVFATKLVARFDAKLAKALPDETHGFAWERQPAVEIDPSIVKGNRIDIERLREALGPFHYSFYLREAPVIGGYLLHERERRVHEADIPLWYDQLPELSTRIPIDGVYSRFYFIEKRHARISPRRGVSKEITIEEKFTLPSGRAMYEFPLYMGDRGASQFVATLRSSALPLRKTVRCALKMTYTYGASQPYNLVFHPLDGELRPMTVVWERKDKRAINVADLPVPDFPVKHDWNELEANGTLEAAAHAFEDMHAYVSGGGNADLIAVKKKHLEENVGSMERRLRKLRKESKDIEALIVELSAAWKPGKVVSTCAADKNGNPFCRVDCEGFHVFCPSSYWADDVTFETLRKEDNVWVSFRYGDNPDKPIAMWMSRSSDRPSQLDEWIAEERGRVDHIKVQMAESFRKSCRHLILDIWDNARSCRDEAAPAWFRERMENVLQKFESDFRDKTIPPQFKSVLAEMLYPLHKDIPAALIEADERDRNEHGIEASSVWFMGFALGDAAADWQRNMLTWILERAHERSYFIPVLRAFSLAFWRDEQFVRQLLMKDCRAICATLNDSVKWLFDKIKTGGLSSEQGKFHILSLSTYTFEVMLALIRTRRSPDAEISRLFIPGSKLANQLLDLVDDFAKVLFERHLELTSRISLKIDKPASLKCTPDLLYALQLYLSGENGANTISISEVGDDEIDGEDAPQNAASNPGTGKRRCSPEILGLFHKKISELSTKVGIRYQHDQVGVCELRQGVWGCQYYTDGFNERPWEQAFLCVRPQQNCLETHGGICDYWNKMGGWKSSLGLPLSDEEDFFENNQSRGRVSHFEHGDVIWLYDENRIDVRMKS